MTIIHIYIITYTSDERTVASRHEGEYYGWSLVQRCHSKQLHFARIIQTCGEILHLTSDHINSAPCLFSDQAALVTLIEAKVYISLS